MKNLNLQPGFSLWTLFLFVGFASLTVACDDDNNILPPVGLQAVTFRT